MPILIDAVIIFRPELSANVKYIDFHAVTQNKKKEEIFSSVFRFVVEITIILRSFVYFYQNISPIIYLLAEANNYAIILMNQFSVVHSIVVFSIDSFCLKMTIIFNVKHYLMCKCKQGVKTIFFAFFWAYIFLICQAKTDYKKCGTTKTDNDKATQPKMCSSRSSSSVSVSVFFLSNRKPVLMRIWGRTRLWYFFKYLQNQDLN